jgi:hypothetical protein
MDNPLAKMIATGKQKKGKKFGADKTRQLALAAAFAIKGKGKGGK